MKKINRWLSALVCLCLLCTFMPGEMHRVFAEGELTDAAIYEEQELILGGRANMPVSQDTPLQKGAEERDFSAFEFGYATIVESAELTDSFRSMNPALAVIPAGEHVLVVERIAQDGTDQVRVSFVYEGTVVEAWMDASAMLPMTEDEVMAFQDGIIEAVCYQDNVEYPLPEPQLAVPEIASWPTQSPVESIAPEATVEATATPEMTVEPMVEAIATQETTVEPTIEETAAPETTVDPTFEGTDAPEETVSPEATEQPITTDIPEITEQPMEEPVSETEPLQVMMMTSLFSMEDTSSVVTMQLATSSAELRVGESVPLLTIFSDGGSYPVGYSLSASGVVSIDGATGMVTAIAPGVVTIQVRCAELENASAEFTVLVTELESQEAVLPETTIAPAFMAVDMVVGESLPMTDPLPEGVEGTIEYIFSADDVVSMDENGNLVAIGEGTCTVTAVLAVPMVLDLYSEPTAPAILSERQITVQNVQTTVNLPADSIQIVDAPSVLGREQVTAPISYKLFAGSIETTGQVTFATSNKKVVQVNAQGQLRGMKRGSATITVSCGEVTADFKVTVKNAPKKLTISPTSATLAVGQSAPIRYKLTSDTAAGMAFTSYNPDVVTVDASGVVTAVAPGTATVRVTTHNGLGKDCEITVNPAPTSIALTAGADKLGVGMTTKVAATADSFSDVKFTYRYWTNSPGVISVDEATGEITALSLGTANVYAETYNGVSSNTPVQIRVVPKPDRVSIDGDSFNITVGRVIQLPIVMESSNGSDECMATYTLSTSNKRVAAVNNAGQVKGAKAGTATITLTASTGDVAEVSVVVRAKPRKVVLNKGKLSLGVGMDAALAARVYYSSSKYFTYSRSDVYGVGQFTSNNPEVASVDPATGVIHAERPGTATITFSTYSGKSASCKVSIVGEPTSIGLNVAELSLGVAMRSKLNVSFNENEYSAIAYSSSNPSVATVSVDGEVVATGMGTATITATALNGVRAQCTVSVLPAPDTIALRVTSSNMAIGGKIALEPVFTYQGTNNCIAEPTYKSSNTKVAKVSDDGVVTGVRAGSATIRAYLQNGQYADCQIVVRKKPSKVKLDQSELYMGMEQRASISARIYFSGGSIAYSPDDTSYVRMTIDDPNVARIDPETGEVVAVGVGSTVLRVKTYNNRSAKCAIHVVPSVDWISLENTSLTMNAGESTAMQCSYTPGAMTAIAYTSSDPKVANVDGSSGTTCRVDALSRGTATITATSSNGLISTCQVTVLAVPERVTFERTAITIGVQETIAIPRITVTSSQGQCSQSVSYSIEGVAAQITSDGYVSGVRAGTATIIAKAGDVTATCLVTVVDAGGLQLSATRTVIELRETVQITSNEYPSGLIFASSNSSVATVDANGLVTGVSGGEAVIAAKSPDGKVGRITISVLGGKLRMLSAYYYGEAGDRGYLPFSYNNATSMAQVFSAATVHGRQYDVAGPISNASKSTLLGKIDSHFAGATEEDISLIYICSHGAARYGASGEYAFGINTTEYVTASELMSCLERIRGRVILIMDSCYSGGMIDCNKGRLDAQGGRISILTSSRRSTNSCYWNVPGKLTAVDFFTHAALQGLGFNEANGIGGSRGWFRDIGGPADDAGNQNTEITLKEMFNYAQKVTKSNVKKLKGRKEFYGNPAQNPQCYLGANADLVIFSR